MKIDQRRQIPAFLSHCNLTGDCVELGVYKGEFSALLLANAPIKRLFSVDRWSGERGHGLREAFHATARLAPYGARSIVLRASFDEAISLFKDGSLDFVYVDGYAHEGNEGGQTVRGWWQKVKSGGILGGHDYSENWPHNKSMVDGFAREVGEPMLVTSKDKDPSWMIFKP